MTRSTARIDKRSRGEDCGQRCTTIVRGSPGLMLEEEEEEEAVEEEEEAAAAAEATLIPEREREVGIIELRA